MVADTRPLIQLALNLLDVLNGSSVPAEVIAKTVNNILLSHHQYDCAS